MQLIFSIKSFLAIVESSVYLETLKECHILSQQNKMSEKLWVKVILVCESCEGLWAIPF